MSAPEHETEAVQPRRSYRQGDALKDALAALNRAPARPMVTISRDANGSYGYDVRVTADDADDAATIALAIEHKLAELYPPAAPTPERHKVSLTRNAKGETQIDLEGRYTDDADLIATAERYESLRSRYPLADGKATHDKPKDGTT